VPPAEHEDSVTCNARVKQSVGNMEQQSIIEFQKDLGSFGKELEGTDGMCPMCKV
jgi:hypothetical protein